MSDYPESIYVVGFVRRGGGNGGFEWRRSFDEADCIRRDWLETGVMDVSPVREVTLDGEVHGDLHVPARHPLTGPDTFNEAVTEALDAHPEFWEPAEWPVHQPEAHDAPIPGRHWYAGCEPGGDWDSELGTYTGTGPRVDPSTGRCESCRAIACPICGREACPDHDPAPVAS